MWIHCSSHFHPIRDSTARFPDYGGLRLAQAQLKGSRALLNGRSDDEALLARKLEYERDEPARVDARSAIHRRRMRRSGG